MAENAQCTSGTHNVCRSANDSLALSTEISYLHQEHSPSGGVGDEEHCLKKHHADECIVPETRERERERPEREPGEVLGEASVLAIRQKRGIVTDGCQISSERDRES